MSDYKHIQVSSDGDVTVVDLVDREMSDLLLQDDFTQELMSLVTDTKPAKMLLRFNSVEYCNTGIINTLIGAQRQAAQHEGVVKLCGLNKHVYDAFVALHLIGTVFNVYENCEDAMAAFAAD